MTQLRIGVVGLGRMGRLHLRALRAMPQVRTLVTADRHHAEPGIGHVSAAADLIGRVDAAIVATPAQDHQRTASLLLAAGIPCLVEKPLALSTADAQQLVTTAARSGVPLAVGHTERFNPQVGRAAVLLAEARPGVRIIRQVTGRPRDAADVVHDLMIHDLDWVGAALGTPQHVAVRYVHSVDGMLRKVHCELHFACGRRVELLAEHEAAQPRRALVLPDAGVLDLAAPADLVPDPLTAQASSFLSLLRGTPSRVASGEEAAAAVRLAEQISCAAAEHAG